MSYSQLEENRNGRRGTATSNGGGGAGASSDGQDQQQQQQQHRQQQQQRQSSSSLSEPLTGGGGADVESGVRNPLGSSSPPQASGGAASSEDPFYVFRQDLYQQLELVDENLAEYLRIVHQTDTAVNTHELKDAKKQLKRHIKMAESTLKDVQATVQAVERDREKFRHSAGIDDGELYDRQSLVRASLDRLSRAKRDANSEAVKAKLLADERSKAMRRAASATGDAHLMGAKTDGERENTSFIVDSQARTSLLVQHQDETLDDLDAAVVRVGEMAVTINEEVGHQNKMLTEMEEDLTDAEEQLGVVMGNLAKFLKTNDKMQLCTILGLSLTAVVLLLLVFYT